MHEIIKFIFLCISMICIVRYGGAAGLAVAMAAFVFGFYWIFGDTGNYSGGNFDRFFMKTERQRIIHYTGKERWRIRENLCLI